MKIQAPERKIVLLILLSALLHGLGLFRLFMESNLLEPPQPVTAIYQKVEPAPASRGTQNQARRRRLSDIPLTALTPKMPVKLQTPEDWTRDTEDYHPQLSWKDSQAYDAFNFSAHSNHSKEHLRFVSSLWRMIDQYIEENPFLSEYNHTGDIFLRFEVDQDGKLVPGSLQASGDDRVLKVIAARATRKAILNETGDVSLPEKRTTMNARFSWNSYHACRSRRGFSGNNLSFCHYAENKRKTFSKAEKVGAWAGAISKHGPWAYEEIQKYNREERRRKLQFNPFKKYERDPDWNL